MKNFVILLVLFALSACCTTPDDKPPAALADSKKKVDIDPRLLKDCEDFTKIKTPRDTDILAANAQWINAYKECKDNKRELNVLVKKAFNLEK